MYFSDKSALDDKAIMEDLSSELRSAVTEFLIHPYVRIDKHIFRKTAALKYAQPLWRKKGEEKEKSTHSHNAEM